MDHTSPTAPPTSETAETWAAVWTGDLRDEVSLWVWLLLVSPGTHPGTQLPQGEPRPLEASAMQVGRTGLATTWPARPQRAPVRVAGQAWWQTPGLPQFAHFSRCTRVPGLASLSELRDGWVQSPQGSDSQLGMEVHRHKQARCPGSRQTLAQPRPWLQP